MSLTYDHFTSQVILVASLEEKPGKGDEVQNLLTAIHAFANSSSEPGCLTFRTVRSGDRFKVFEQYVNKDAVSKHFEGAQFKKLAESIPGVLTGPPALEYYEEFSSA
ncbi:antibiotic biosynthesis monooxygenase [Pyrrhoderma noxium]|uniref:Antibiotic biosynthesis monooxygenase n=1 Tax=Pyrrhoderma noxium TaxID=2282107 RepID=A0A286UR18_9AGAM|nr:antibiotic biosynthesis monooxygenase [Pyrrhoderma noxium]